MNINMYLSQSYRSEMVIVSNYMNMHIIANNKLYIPYKEKKQRAIIRWKIIESQNPDNMRRGTW